MLPVKVTTSIGNSTEYPEVDKIIFKTKYGSYRIIERKYIAFVPGYEQFHMLVNRQILFKTTSTLHTDMM